jgi:predicted RNA-binding Zn-ribbon protein involved in translation (DUF1610 family)
MSDSPYELQALVTVATFNTPWEAQIAQARLGAEGFYSLIADENVIRLVALSNAVGGIRLKVRERDAAAAAAVLRRLVPLPEIYLVTGDAPGAAGEPAEAAGDGRGPAAAEVPAAAPAEAREGPPPHDGAAGGEEAGAAGLACPACGSADLWRERSSRLLLGVLPLGRRGYRCGDCGILWRVEELRGEPPLAGAEVLTTVARFHTPWEAHLARTYLESAGLRCCVFEERLPAVHLLSAQPVAYNRLEVRSRDAARATAILARASAYPSPVAPPEADAENETGGADPRPEGGDPRDDGGSKRRQR